MNRVQIASSHINQWQTTLSDLDNNTPKQHSQTLITTHRKTTFSDLDDNKQTKFSDLDNNTQKQHSQTVNLWHGSQALTPLDHERLL